MGPLSPARAERLVSFLSSGLGDGTVLDLGCGWGELLLRVVQAAPDSRGLGIDADADADAIAHGLDLARRRDLTHRVTLVHGDARVDTPDRARAVLCIGASQIWGPAEQDQPLDYSAALAALRGLLPSGGRLVYGESIWARQPTPAATAALSGRSDEFIALPALVDLATEHGFVPMAVHQATTDEWDTLESGYGACYARWLGEHGLHHPDAPAVLAAARSQREA